VPPTRTPQAAAKIDVQINLNQINHHLYQQLDVLHPCGIENPDPVFWTPNVRVVEQKIVGKGHLKLTFSQETGTGSQKTRPSVLLLGERRTTTFPYRRESIFPPTKRNSWNGNTTIELELVGVRLPTQHLLFFPSTDVPSKAAFTYKQRHYTCGILKQILCLS
jgi:single-stranded-DNA-specific exonuclease